MNNPFALYPNFLSSSFNPDSRMVRQAINLLDYITKLTENPPDVLYIPIGMGAEEKYANKLCDPCYFGNQWMQLFPYFLQNCIIKNPEKRYEIILIAPNDHINITSSSFIEPVFLLKTMNKFKWKKNIVKDVLSYESQTYNVKYTIFNCSFPYYDQMNRDKIEKIKERIDFLYRNDIMYMTDDIEIDETKNYYNKLKKDVDNFISTREDEEFVLDFYSNINDLMDLIESNGGVNIIISYSTFEYSSELSYKYSNFGLFPKIKSLFNQENKNRILAEWIHKDDCTSFYLYNDYEQQVEFRKPYSYINEESIKIKPFNSDELIIELF